MELQSFLLGRKSVGGGGGGGGESGGGSGGVLAPKDVVLIDYDGTLLHTYTAAEFAALTAMPEGPSHAGLTFVGWNWSLADAKAHAAKYGRLVVGAEYQVADGKTRARVSVRSDAEKTVQVGFRQTAGGGVSVDWGDGSSPQTTGAQVFNVTHTYSAYGDYEVTLTVTEGVYTLNGLSGSGVRHAEIGDVAGLGSSVFSGNFNMETVVIPSGLSIGSGSAFENCVSLRGAVLPQGAAPTGDTFNGCSGLRWLSLPNGMTAIPEWFVYKCARLERVTLPDTVTSIGPNAFYEHTMDEIILPERVTTVGAAAFRPVGNSNRVVRSCNATPPTLADSNSLYYVMELYVPAGSGSTYKAATNWTEFADAVVEM